LRAGGEGRQPRNDLPLYPFITEHDGSTFVEQHVADTPRQAMVDCL
jgi:hypothetical protein